MASKENLVPFIKISLFHYVVIWQMCFSLSAATGFRFLTKVSKVFISHYFSAEIKLGLWVAVTATVVRTHVHCYSYYRKILMSTM